MPYGMSDQNYAKFVAKNMETVELAYRRKLARQEIDRNPFKYEKGIRQLLRQAHNKRKSLKFRRDAYKIAYSLWTLVHEPQE